MGEERTLTVDKQCIGCDCIPVIVTLPVDRESLEVRTEDDCLCPDCGLTGFVVLHGAEPGSDDIEDTFDIQWTDPETGGDYRI